MQKQIIILLWLLFFAVTAMCQSSLDIESFINNEMVKARSNQIISYEEREFTTSEKKAVLIDLKKFEIDSSVNVRFLIQTIRFKIAVDNEDILIRQEVVNDLVSDCSDTNPLIYQQAIKRLKWFVSNDFSIAAKNRLVILSHRIKNDPELLLVIGIASIYDLASNLKENASNFIKNKNGWYTSAGWYATLALARMGSSDNIEKVIANVEAEPDTVLKVTKLLADVNYIRQPKGIKFLQKYLESEDRLPSVKSNVPGTKYNQYALAFLAQSIKNFPVEYKGVGYSESELATARSWMRNHFDYIIIR